MTPTQDILQNFFKLSDFRRGQKEIISAVLAGRDVMAVLPTGGGKSLCYQYPAVFKNELVIVVSPLIALMKDQVAGLRRLGIPAGCLHSGQKDSEKREIFQQMDKGGPYLLYLSPERVQKEGFQRWIAARKIALFAIDEAHCVSQWGHDFREEYSQLKILKSLRPDVPILALTASATPFVLNDISKQLNLKSPERHVHGFYRSNLYFQVESCANDEEKLEMLKQALRQNSEGRVLVYCGTRKITEALANELEREFSGVGFYHAGLTNNQRTAAQESYATGELRILIATNAFGMGIDHPDVRLVVHYQMPANIDSLYQEMGRAGRDGQHSTCVMLYAKKDKGLQSFFITQSGAPPQIQSSRWNTLDHLVEYAEGGECRHAEILTYYQDSQRIESCGHCDVCAPTSDRRVKSLPASFFSKITSLQKKVRGGRSSGSKAPPAASQSMDSTQTEIFEMLRAWRKKKSKELDVPAFVIMSDKTLRHLATARPSTEEELKEIYGLGEAKIEKFGQEILQGPMQLSPLIL